MLTSALGGRGLWGRSPTPPSSVVQQEDTEPTSGVQLVQDTGHRCRANRAPRCLSGDRPSSEGTSVRGDAGGTSQQPALGVALVIAIPVEVRCQDNFHPVNPRLRT